MFRLDDENVRFLFIFFPGKTCWKKQNKKKKNVRLLQNHKIVPARVDIRKQLLFVFKVSNGEKWIEINTACTIIVDSNV